MRDWHTMHRASNPGFLRKNHRRFQRHRFFRLPDRTVSSEKYFDAERTLFQSVGKNGLRDVLNCPEKSLRDGADVRRNENKEFRSRNSRTERGRPGDRFLLRASAHPAERFLYNRERCFLLYKKSSEKTKDIFALSEDFIRL